MAIKERKQITGTEAQIKDYAGHNGVLAYATDTKHLHVLSGTAGASTKLANVSDIPAPVDISGKADKTYVDLELAKKQPTGDYATNSALTTGLAGKLDAAGKAQTAGTADTANALASTAKVPYSQLTGTPSIPDVSNLIPKDGDGGTISVYETYHPLSSGDSISLDSPSTLVVDPGTTPCPITLGINGGQSGKGATKLLYVFNPSSFTFTHATDVYLTWTNAIVPTLKANNVIVLTFLNSNVISAHLVSAWDN